MLAQTICGEHNNGLCFSQIQHTDDMENEMDELLQEFEDKSHRPFLHTVCFYWTAQELSSRGALAEIALSLCLRQHTPQKNARTETFREEENTHTAANKPIRVKLSLRLKERTPYLITFT